MKRIALMGLMLSCMVTVAPRLDEETARTFNSDQPLSVYVAADGHWEYLGDTPSETPIELPAGAETGYRAGP